MAVLTCHTEGCGNAGIPISLDIADPETGELADAWCGACGQPITDVAPDAVPGGDDDPWPF